MDLTREGAMQQVDTYEKAVAELRGGDTLHRVGNEANALKGMMQTAMQAATDLLTTTIPEPNYSAHSGDEAHIDPAACEFDPAANQSFFAAHEAAVARIKAMIAE